MEPFCGQLVRGARLVGNDRAVLGDVVLQMLLGGVHRLCQRTPYQRERFVQTANDLKRAPEFAPAVFEFCKRRAPEVDGGTQRLWRLKNIAARCGLGEDSAAALALTLVWFDDAAAAASYMQKEGVAASAFASQTRGTREALFAEAAAKKLGDTC